MHRFFLDPAPHISAGTIVMLPDKLAHQVRTVLHIGVGEHLILLDDSGDELLCVVRTATKKLVEVEIMERRAGQKASPVRMMLCQSVLKTTRFEWILEKGTELGVSVFAPILSQRSMAGLDGAGNAKQQRWQRIVQEATEQCGRARRPVLHPIRPLAQVLAELPPRTLAFMPWEEEQVLSLHRLLRSVPLEEHIAADGTLTVAFFIGPEGGLTSEEAELAHQHGVRTVSLGPRILRAETAAIITAANVMYELEERLSGSR